MRHEGRPCGNRHSSFSTDRGGALAGAGKVAASQADLRMQPCRAAHLLPSSFSRTVAAHLLCGKVTPRDLTRRPLRPAAAHRPWRRGGCGGICKQCVELSLSFSCLLSVQFWWNRKTEPMKPKPILSVPIGFGFLKTEV